MRDELMKIAEGTPAGLLVNAGKEQLSPVFSARGKKEAPTMQAPAGSDPPAPPEDTEPTTTQGGDLTKLQSAFFKLSQDVTRGEAEDALRRLRKLEREAPTSGELSRNALAGAAVMPAVTTASSLVAGNQPLQESIKEYREAKKALKAAPPGPQGKTVAMKPGAPSTLGKAVKRGLWRSGRGMAGAALSGAVLGAGLPVARGYLHREAEKEKLREYLGVSKRGKLRRRVKKQLGV
jgi:hypothetical protein